MNLKISRGRDDYNYAEIYTSTAVDFLEENLLYSSIGIQLIDINGDSVKELVIMGSPGQGGDLFTIVNGDVIHVETDGFPVFGEYGVFVYYPELCVFQDVYENVGEEQSEVSTWFFQIDKNGKAELIEEAITKYDYSEDRLTYFIDGNEVSEKEYDNRMARYNSNSEKTVQYYDCKQVSSKQEIVDYLLDEDQY